MTRGWPFCILHSALCIAAAAAAAAADPWTALADAERLPAAEARAALEKLLLDQPGFHAAHFNLGTRLLAGDVEAAARHLEAATAAADPHLAADAWHNLALARWQQGRLEDAVAAAVKAADLDPALAPARDEIRRSALARLDAARRKAAEEAKRLAVTGGTLPPGRVGEPYRAPLPVRGGKPPYRISGESLPGGLAIAGTELAGTPQASGRYELRLTVRDASGGTATGAAALEVIPAPRITTTELPEAIIGLPYRAPLACEGLDRPRWTAAPLPAGLTFAGSDLAGTPTATGTWTVHVTALDAERRAGADLELRVTDAFAPAEAELPPATQWVPYRHRLGVRGPAQDYRWQATAQGGIAIAPDGSVSGSPDETGRLALSATIAAADGRQRGATVHLPVNPPPVVAEPEPIRLAAGAPVARSLRAEGGTPPLTWTLAEGALPAGLRLLPDGRLGGVAGAAGSAEVTVQVADRWNATAKQAIRLQIEAGQGKPQDNQDQQQKDQKQDQKDGSKDGKKDQKQDQKQPGQSATQADPQQGKDQQTAQAEPQPAQAATAADPAETINQAAAERWLERLPDEDRGAIRYQLLDGGDLKPGQKGKPW